MQFAGKIKDTLMKKDHSKVQQCNNLSSKPYQQLISAKTLVSMKMTNYLEFCFYCQKVASRKIYNKLTALYPKQWHCEKFKVKRSTLWVAVIYKSCTQNNKSYMFTVVEHYCCLEDLPCRRFLKTVIRLRTSRSPTLSVLLELWRVASTRLSNKSGWISMSSISIRKLWAYKIEQELTVP